VSTLNGTISTASVNFVVDTMLEISILSPPTGAVVSAPVSVVDAASVHRARFLAKRFAAKEAFVKALGTGMRHPATWHNINVTHDALGRPGFGFSPDLTQGLAQRGIRKHHLSISDEAEMVVAFSILEQ